MFVRLVATAFACILLSGLGGGVASAKQCRDAHGKFMKCPAPMSAPMTRCRDAKGKFMKCPAMKK